MSQSKLNNISSGGMVHHPPFLAGSDLAESRSPFGKRKILDQVARIVAPIVNQIALQMAQEEVLDLQTLMQLSERFKIKRGF